jgi:hypothetical protein
VKISFSTVDPSAFGRIKDIDKNYVSPREKKKQARLAKIGSLFTHSCGNTSCMETIDFIYESGKSEGEIKRQSGWSYFPRIVSWLCPVCADIQLDRDTIKLQQITRRLEARKARKALAISKKAQE